MHRSILRELLDDAATPSRLVPAVSSGLVLGVLCVVIELSLASLIFSGPLAGFAAKAAGLTLCGATVMCLFVALCSAFPSSICAPQDASAAVMATVGASVAASLAASGHPEHAAVTVGAGMVVSTLATGLMFLVMGRFDLGNLMRYVPYPVMGGFMAGIGWLLVQGGVGIVTGVSLSFHDLPALLAMDKLLRLLPAALLAFGLIAALGRWSNAFILPGTLVAAAILFVLYLAATGMSLENAQNAGYLLGGMPDGGALWPVFRPEELTNIAWGALLPQAPQLGTIPIIATISLLLTASGVEAATRTDQDLSRELSANGLANILGAVVGSQAGYTALSLSLLGPRTGSVSRLSGVFCALVLGVATFCGAGVLGYFPRFILGGMVLFLGVATLLDWVVAARPRVSRVDHALILGILCAIAVFGFLPGVALGMLAAAVIFVVKYSRLPVLRLDTDATTLSSARQRSVPDRLILREHGGKVRVLGVMGYLFFGSAHAVCTAASARLRPEGEGPPSHLILDFAEADGFDSSAVNSFLRLLQRCAAVGCQAVFAAAPHGLERQMRRAGAGETSQAVFLPDLDRALEHCEDELLASETTRQDDAPDGRERLFDLAVDDMLVHLEEGERFEALVERLGPRLSRRTAAGGEIIATHGEDPAGIWFLLAGQAEETTVDAEDAATRLRTLAPGALFGRAAGRAGQTAPCTVTAMETCSLAFLPEDALTVLEKEDSEAALTFYRLFAGQLEMRLAKVLPHKCGQTLE